ncbi:MAG: hypothetical protein ACREEE_16115 [Dongiaceae bacterium]
MDQAARQLLSRINALAAEIQRETCLLRSGAKVNVAEMEERKRQAIIRCRETLASLNAIAVDTDQMEASRGDIAAAARRLEHILAENNRAMKYSVPGGIIMQAYERRVAQR